MKNASLNMVYCIFFVVIFPIIIYLIFNNTRFVEENKSANFIKVFNVQNKEVMQIPLEEYVWRVTAKEIPFTFENDAIKAQSVAARTYAVRKIGADIPEHNGADVCTDFSHCTAFLTIEEENLINNKTNNGTILRYKKITAETQDEILTFENKPILAVFYSISSGITEKSSDVWSTQLPYLVNVNSELDKNVDGYHSAVVFTKKQLENVFTKSSHPEIKIISRTDGGSVKHIEIFGNTYTGQEVRNKLNLRSANFTVTQKGDAYTFDVLGYGHGVGMSQHGANEYAKTGMNYKEILGKYYPSTTLTTINKIKSAD